MEKKILLFILVLIGALVATYSFAHNAPTVEVFSPSEVGTGAGPGRMTGEGLPVIEAANITTNESEAEIEKIDSDGDGTSDWFEENYTHTDPSVANDRYLLHVVAHSHSGGSKNRTEKFIKEYKFAPENTIIIENASFSDFKKAVDQIAEKADENDFVYIQLIGHGAGPKRRYEIVEQKDLHQDGKTHLLTRLRIEKGWVESESRMVFAESRGVPYREIGEILNKIKCQKMLVAYFSCACNTGVEPLNETLNKDIKYPRVIIGPIEIDWILFKPGYPENKDMVIIEETLYQEINESYLSIQEYFQYRGCPTITKQPTDNISCTDIKSSSSSQHPFTL